MTDSNKLTNKTATKK